MASGPSQYKDLWGLMRAWGWEWKAPVEIRCPTGSTIHLQNNSFDWILDRFRAAARDRVLAGLRKKDDTIEREDMRGVGDLEWTATRGLLQGKVTRAWRLNRAQRSLEPPGCHLYRATPTHLPDVESKEVAPAGVPHLPPGGSRDQEARLLGIPRLEGSTGQMIGGTTPAR